MTPLPVIGVVVIDPSPESHQELACEFRLARFPVLASWDEFDSLTASLPVGEMGGQWDELLLHGNDYSTPEEAEHLEALLAGEGECSFGLRGNRTRRFVVFTGGDLAFAPIRGEGGWAAAQRSGRLLSLNSSDMLAWVRQFQMPRLGAQLTLALHRNRSETARTVLRRVRALDAASASAIDEWLAQSLPLEDIALRIRSVTARQALGTFNSCP